MSRFKPSRGKRSKKSKSNNQVLIDFSHRLALSDGKFNPKGASTLVNDYTHRTSCVLELLKNHLVCNDITPLSRDVICHVLFSISMELGDISALMVAFQKTEKEKQTALNVILQKLTSVKKIIKNMCENLAKGGDNYIKENNQNIGNSIDAMKTDLLNIGKIFSDLCLFVEN